MIVSNIAKANNYLQRYGETIEIIRQSESDDVADELRKDYDLFDDTLKKFDQHCKILLEKCKAIETQDDELVILRKKAHSLK